MRKKTLIVSLLIAVLFSAGWYFGSPAWTIKQMRDAAVAGDSEALAAHVDFPSVRDGLKSQVKAEMMAKVAEAKEQNPFAALGAMIAMNMIDPLIDGIITPDGLKHMMTRGKFSNPDKTPSADKGPATEWAITRTNFDQFRAAPISQTGDKVPALVFQRDGISWRLTKIDIPSGGLGGSTPATN